VTSDKVNILIVDDLPEKLLVLDTVLAELGENIVVARSGEEALMQVLRHEFAVILLDVNMPSMDGYEAAALIRKRRRSAHTPIIFITAYADELHKAEGYSLGAVDYVMSPVNPAILRTKVRVFVDLFKMAQQAMHHAEERVALVHEQAARLAAEAARASAEATLRRTAFLAEMSAKLATSLDQEAMVRNLATLAIPFLADLSAVSLISEPGRVDRTELAWSNPADGSVVSANIETAALPSPLGDAVKRALSSGKMELIEKLRVRPAGPNSEWGEQVGSGPPFGVRSALVLPLRARDQTLGILILALGHSERQTSPEDALHAEVLASRAAAFLENARLYRNIQESDARKNEFLAMLAHELRNPLAAIRGAVQVMCLPDLAPEKMPWARAVIDRQVNQLVRLVDDLLDAARISQGKIRLQMELVELTAVVTLAMEFSNPLIEARKHRLNVQWSKVPLWIRGDATRLAQVVANLLNNAVKYTDEGGQIGLSIEEDHGFAVLRVRDNGIGIPEQLIGRIFDLFTQANQSLDRSQGGLGIGLTLVRHLVEMHGGSVSVSSPGLNKGSEFTVRLPLHVREVAPQPPVAKRSPSGVPSRRVLVVDDNPDILESMSVMLEQSGHHVKLAQNGNDALDVAAQFMPEVVLLDIGLPGLDGYEVARHLRKMPELDKSIFVALTGYGQTEVRHRAFDAGFDLHLVKPIDLQTLDKILMMPLPPRIKTH